MAETMVDLEVITSALELACRAPSLHNSQPWRWVVDSTVVDLFRDPGRAVRSVDGSGREAIISCGAALDHFRVAMAAAGWDINVDQFPNPNDLNHLASVDFTALDYVADARRDRADAITHRRTDRLPFSPPKNWEAFEPVLRNSFDDELVTLDVLADDVRPQLAEASRLSESLRRYDDFYHHELQWWTAPLRELEGVPQSALVSDSEAHRVEVNRRFPASGYSERRVAITEDQARILALSTPENTHVDALNCGQVLSAVLLECTLAELATCTLTHITEVEASRQVIRDLIGSASAMPQALIRVGTAPPVERVPEPTPRLPLSDVVEFRH